MSGLIFWELFTNKFAHYQIKVNFTVIWCRTCSNEVTLFFQKLLWANFFFKKLYLWIYFHFHFHFDSEHHLSWTLVSAPRLFQNRAQCVAVWCSKCCKALQCVAVCCSVLQCVAVCCSVLQCVAVWCSKCCKALQCFCEWDCLPINLIVLRMHMGRLRIVGSLKS